MTDFNKLTGKFLVAVVSAGVSYISYKVLRGKYICKDIVNIPPGVYAFLASSGFKPNYLRHGPFANAMISIGSIIIFLSGVIWISKSVIHNAKEQEEGDKTSSNSSQDALDKKDDLDATQARAALALPPPLCRTTSSDANGLKPENTLQHRASSPFPE